MTNISLSAGGKQLLASGVVLLSGGESLLIKLEDGGEELSFEIVIQGPEPPQGETKRPQLTFSRISETSGKLTFLNTTGPFALGYQISLGTINKKKLAAIFGVVNLAPLNELKYSFWVGPEANG